MSRHFATSQVKFGFKWETAWIPTEENVLPDALSRWSDEKYQSVFKEHCAKLGIRNPTRRQVSPEMFKF